MFTLQCGITSYGIVGPAGEQGEVVDYGSPAFITVNGAMYMAYLDPETDDDGNVVEGWDHRQQREPVNGDMVYPVGPGAVASLEDVTFDFEEAEEEEEEEEEEEGEGEETEDGTEDDTEDK